MDKETKQLIHRTLIVTAVLAAAYLLVSHFDALIAVGSKILSAFSPLFIGMFMSLILNVALCKFENLLKKNKKIKNVRLFALILTYLSAFIVLCVFVTVVVPQFYNSMVSIVEKLPSYAENVFGYANSLFDRLGLDIHFDSDEASLSKLASSLTKSITTTDSPEEWLKQIVPQIFSGITAFAGSIIGTIINVMMAVLFSVYLLYSKEKYLKVASEVMDHLFKKKISSTIKHVVTTFSQTYSNFLGGQLMEMTILGTIFFIVLSIASMPFALLISIVIALTSVVPYFGTTLAAVIGAVLILAEDGLIKMIIFIIIFMVVQWVENNFIYPNVVGSIVGLSPIWVLLGIAVFGDLFGIIGMLVAVPSTAVIYTLLKEVFESKKVISK